MINLDDAIQRLRYPDGIPGQLAAIQESCIAIEQAVAMAADELEGLRNRVAELTDFAANQPCNCLDVFNQRRTEMCDRCKLLGREW